MPWQITSLSEVQMLLGKGVFRSQGGGDRAGFDMELVGKIVELVGGDAGLGHVAGLVQDLGCQMASACGSPRFAPLSLR